MGKIIVTDEIMDKIQRGFTANEALREKYNGEIQDKIKADEKYANMTPMQMALADAGITKNTLIGDAINQGTITTQQNPDWLVPAYIDTTVHEIINKNDILKYIVASSASANSMVIQSHYLDLNDPSNLDAAKLARVSEGADLPLAKIKLGESAIRLFKYGRAVEQTYEAMSQMTFDEFTKTLELLSNDVSNQQVKAATQVALKGDGNNNAAQEIKINYTTGIATDEGLQNELVDAFIEYNRTSGMPLTTVIAGGATYKRLAKLMYQTDMGAGVSARYSFNTPQITSGNIVLVDYGTDEIMVGSSANKKGALLLNGNMALTKHFLNGSLIREYSQNIRNQTKLGTISEIAGFSKNTPDGVKYVQLEK